MASNRAPKQWTLTRTENITSFESWRQNLLYILSLDPLFAPFLLDGVTWTRKSHANPTRGLANDGASVPAANRLTAAQKASHLELLLGQVANYAPVIARNTIVRNSTSLESVWQALRQHYGFKKTGSHFLDLADMKLECDERPEDLFQRLTAFVDDNLLKQNGGIAHHGEYFQYDEEVSPTVENLVCLLWLQAIHPGLPRLVKQRYGTELRCRTLASVKPEISLALDSLLDELRCTEEMKVMRTAPYMNRTKSTPPMKRLPQRKSPKLCPLCREAGRPSGHFLSTCKFLPDADRKYFARARLTMGVDECLEYTDEDINAHVEDENAEPDSHYQIQTDVVNINKSPELHVFHGAYPLRLTLDTGAESNMISTTVARYMKAKIVPSKHKAVQADGSTPLSVAGETHTVVTRGNTTMHLDALVVDDLNVDVLAGMPFLKNNDVSLHPSRNEIVIKGTVVKYGHPSPRTTSPHIRRAQIDLIRAPVKTLLYPGEYIELPVPPHLTDSEVIMEPREDTNQDHKWLRPSIVRSVDDKIRLVNESPELLTIRKHSHVCQVTPVTDDITTQGEQPPPAPRHFNTSNIDQVSIDPDKQLPSHAREMLHSCVKKYEDVFRTDIPGYNGKAGPCEAVVNMGPSKPPQRKGRMPLYPRQRLEELQAKFDELESQGVFSRPQDIGVNVEYVNPSFLVHKPSGGFRLVTAFADVGKYCKPQPSLMPNVDETLRTIARWNIIITTDLTKAFYQIPLSRNSMSYCGVVTPFRGLRVYTRCAMGMPGSETALEELLSLVLGPLIQEGVVCKLADDLYCGGSDYKDLLHNWSRLLDALHKCELRLSAAKTVIAPVSTTILGWLWRNGTISASPHKISTLASCKPPETVKSLRSFIGAYKALARVIPNCASQISELESATCNSKSADKIIWTDSLDESFRSAQSSLSNNKTITLPRPDDVLWIVTDGSVTRHGVGSTLYVTRDGKTLLAGFHSAKLKKHHIKWLPCEIEALAIASAITHFAPYIIQATTHAYVLTDSKPCVQALEKLYRGEFSASPRVTTFLTVASRYQVTLHHLAGNANIPSDFASRNAPECREPRCQICAFIAAAETSVVHSVDVSDILSGVSKVPFTSRAAWLAAQREDTDLRRVYAHLSQGTRPSKRDTNVKDVKRYLQHVSIAKDGLLVVKRLDSQPAMTEAIVVPRSAMCGLLTVLHLRLNHPSRHQLQQVVVRYFFCLNLSDYVAEVTEQCHTCQSLKATRAPCFQSSEEPPESVGIRFAADILRRERQFIFMLRETVTSYTMTSIISDEKRDTLKSALLQTICLLKPLDGPKCTVRCDAAPGFQALQNDESLLSMGIQLDVGRAKNVNKNPVAEQAVRELHLEILKIEPQPGPITSLQLARATATLNARFRSRGMSAREMWFQRDQFTNDQLPIHDIDLIKQQQSARTINHPYSVKSKRGSHYDQQDIAVGDIVYLIQDKNKSSARPRYIVASIDGDWCFIRKFVGKQLRETAYKVKLFECYRVPCHKYPQHAENQEVLSSPEGDESTHTPLENDKEPEPKVVPGPTDATPDAPPEVPPDTSRTVPSDDPYDLPVVPAEIQYNDDHHTVDDVESSHTPQQEAHSDVDGDSIQTAQPRRSQRIRKPPKYLEDYVT